VPDLDTLLKETMLGVAASGSKGAKLAASPGPMSAPVASPDLDDEDQPIWDYALEGLNKVSSLTCLVRGMAMNMKVCNAIEWERIDVKFRGVEHSLELSEAFLIRSDFLRAGHVPDSSSGLWQLEANTDRSFQHVFGYEIPPTQPGIRPIPASAWSKPTFMPGSAGASGKVSSAAGKITTISVAPVRILVVVSFVCCKWRNDFEPAGALGAGRLYPLVMVMASQDLDGIEADIRLDRPAMTPHTSMDGEIMLPEIKGSFYTDRNGQPLLPTSWPDFFSHYMIEAPAGMYVAVDPALPARSVKDAVEFCPEKYVPTLAWNPKDLPARDAPFDKVAGQGEFDNLHIAPRMVAPLQVLKDYPQVGSLKAISMAPFCAHDCLHTHWRWGVAKVNRKRQLGWQGMTPHALAGAPLVPANQKITVEVITPSSFRYRAEVQGPVSHGQWQVVNHHGSAYALSVTVIGETAKSVQRQWVHDHEAKIGSGKDTSTWAMFYWRLRWRADLGGIHERIHVKDMAKARS